MVPPLTLKIDHDTTKGPTQSSLNEPNVPLKYQSQKAA